MTLDIDKILKEWPYEPGQVAVRRVHGEDGAEKIQMRLDLGLLQMETTGRPDGQRPHGHESLLVYYEHELQRYKTEHGSDVGFELDERACELLRAEGVMYYHRYLAEFVLEDYAAVERDALRNLRLFDLCAAYAKEESDRYVSEQYRPYVIMMSARARAHLSLDDRRPKAALAAVKKGIEDIKSFYRRFGQQKMMSTSSELAVLRAMLKEIEGRIPVDPIRKLKEDLAKAVRGEHYEEAAGIRDQLRTISESSGRPAGPHEGEPEDAEPEEAETPDEDESDTPPIE